MKRFLTFFLFSLPLLLAGQTPEVVLTVGHTDQVNCLTFSPDGKMLVSGGNDNNIKLWDVRTTREIRTLSGNDGRLISVLFNKKGKILGGLNYNSQLRFWDPKTGILLSTFNGVNVNPETFDFCFDQSKVVFINENNEVVIADPQTGSSLRKFKTEGSVVRFRVSKSGETLYMLDHTGHLLEIDLNNGAEKRRNKLFKSFLYPPTKMILSPDGKFLACAFDDQTVRLFSTLTLHETAALKSHSNRIVDLCYSTDGKRLFSVDHDRNLYAWDTEKKKVVRTFEKTIMGFTSLAYHPHEDILAFGEYKSIHYVDAGSGKELKIFKAKGNRILSMSYDQQGKYLATAADDISIKIWNLSTLKIEKKLNGFFPVEFSPDGKKLLCMSNTLKLAVYDPESGALLNELDTETELIQNLSFSKDGKYVAGAGFNGVVKIWEMSSGKLIKKLKGHAGGIYATSFHPAGKWLASCGLDNTIRIWDLDSEKEIAQLTGHEVLVNDVEFSPDGKTLASASWDKSIRLWNSGSWTLKSELKGHENIVTSLSFSSDSKWLVSGSGNNVVAPADNSVRVWDLSDGKAVCRFENPTGQINKVILEQNGSLLFSCADDGMVKIWDIRKCSQIAGLICSNQSDYIIVTPDHYYTASRDALSAVSFRIDDRLFPFEQFDIRLNRPDIIASRIGKTPTNLVNAFYYVYQKRLKRMNFREEDLGTAFHVPVLEVKKAEIPLVTKEKTIKATVKMRDDLYTIDRLQIHVNGVPLYGIAGYDLRKSNSGSIDMEAEISLLPGENKIKFSCFNSQGAESMIEEFSILREANEEKNNLYAIAIGVSDYKDDRFDLKYAAKDAKDVLQRLTEKKENYQNIRQKLLIDADVTKENIYALKDFLAEAGPEDLVVVFIAGHGVLDLNYEYFYGTCDINFDDPAQRGISYSQIEDLFNHVRSQRKLLIMDTCHSGELDKDEIEVETKADVEINEVKFRSVGQGIRQKEVFGVSNTFEMMQLLFADVKNETGTFVISSSGGAEFSMESEKWRNGLFTYCLLSAAGDFKADLNYDKHMSVSELQKYTYEKVMMLSQGRQKPTTRSENLILDFIVW